MTEIELLAAALESFPGVTMIETDDSGDTELVHPGKRMDVGFGTWYVRFSIERSAQGWHTLEELSYIINNTMQLSGARFFILPFAFPPHIGQNAQEDRLSFVIEGGRRQDIGWLVENLRKEHTSQLAAR